MIEPHGFEKLGGLPSAIDERDHQLLGSATPIPSVFLRADFNPWLAPVQYQGQQPACGAHAGSSMKMLLDELSNYSPRYTWIDLKTFDGHAISDGTDMRSIFKSLKNEGVLSFPELGNDVSLSLADYASVSALTPQMKSDANKHLIANYAFLPTISFDALKQAIYKQGAVLLLVQVGKEWWTAASGTSSWKEADILPLRAPESIVSGHFILAHSYDENYIYFLNSWSAQWGRNGHGYFGADYIPFVTAGGTAYNAGAVVFVPFTKDLHFGMIDADVLRLQQWLNAHGYPIAPDGQPGSSGHETNYFGPATQNALIAYQKAKGIAPSAGYFGKLTRASVNG